jgi:hypothetical protein
MDFTLEEFTVRGPALVGAMAQTLGRVLVRQVGARAGILVKAISPIGGVLTKDRHAGLLKASWSEMVTDTSVAWRDTAPHAVIINRGRRRGITPIGAGKRVRQPKHGRAIRSHPQARMLGSTQARAGILSPTLKYLRAEIDKLAEKAISAAEDLAK